MANLETLELTISGNAQSATQGLNSLINSLSALQQAVGRNVGGLQKLNSELSKLKSFKGMKLPSATGASQSVKSTANKVAQSTQDWASTHRWFGDKKGDWHGGATKRYDPSVDAFTVGKAGNGGAYYPIGGAPVSKEIQQMDEAIKRVTGELPKMKGRASELIQPLKEMGEEAEKTGKKTTDGFSKIGRIASTMLIRTALRGIIKAFGEAWNSVYNFSKAMGGEFAQSIDKIRGLLKGAAINLTSAFAPAIAAILPIVNAVAAAINYLAAAIQWLFSLLGLGSGLFGATAEQIDKFSGSAGGGSKAAKEMLASFDELNVISQESGGGGGGGGGGAGALSGMIGEEMDAITVMAGEAMLALGLILAFTGHPLIGGSLIALGVAGIVGPIATKWGDLSEQIKDQILSIMAVAGTAFLAIGAILTFTGANVPLGIALMVAGLANVGGAGALSWDLSDQIREKIAVVESAVSGAFLALGAVLTFLPGGNPIIGIPLLAIGAIGLAHSMATSFDIEGKISSILSNLNAVVGGAMLAIGALLTFTGANIPLGIGLIALGAVKLGSAASESWGFDEKIKGIITSLDGIISVASLALGAILLFTGANIPVGLGLMAAGAVGLGTSIAANWDSIVATVKSVMSSIEEFLTEKWEAIKAVISGAWDAFCNWADENIITPITTAWNAVVQFFEEIWTDISTAITTAWNAVTTWFDENIGENIKAAWETASTFLSSVWTGIKTAAETAWTAVCTWWDTGIGGWITTAWNTAVSFLSSIWESIKTAVTEAWDSVVEWWNNGIGGWISSAWATVAGVFEIAFAPIAVALGWLADLFGYDGKSIRIGINIGVNGIYDGTDAADIADKVMNSTKNGNKYNVRDLYNGLFKASGGLVPSGDLFIANEQGAELVGSIGSHTAVANNDQIIEGISRGVADGQAEQNALLRQQNDLLRDILRKDNSVRVGASAALGRTVRQSLDMYSSMVGG